MKDKFDNTIDPVFKLEDFKFSFNIHLQLERTNKSFDPEFSVITRAFHILLMYNLVRVYCVDNSDFKKNKGYELIKIIKNKIVQKAENRMNVSSEAKLNIALLELHGLIIDTMQKNNLGVDVAGIIDLEYETKK